jgi:hypothetical protein
MIITGIAHNPKRLHETSEQPSTELVYLAARALEKYQATSLVTSLSYGWDAALVKAAVEMKIPFTVAIPYPGRDTNMTREDMVIYYDLLSRAEDVYRINDTYCDTAVYECYCWCVDHSDQVLALWDYEFTGEIFQVIDYSIKHDKRVINLWEDWSQLYTLRKDTGPELTRQPVRGAQVYKGKPNQQ